MITTNRRINLNQGSPWLKLYTNVFQWFDLSTMSERNIHSCLTLLYKHHEVYMWTTLLLNKCLRWHYCIDQCNATIQIYKYKEIRCTQTLYRFNDGGVNGAF